MPQADGTYFTVIYNDEGCRFWRSSGLRKRANGRSWPSALEIAKINRRGKICLMSVPQRGVTDIDLWGSSGNQTMINAITKKFPTAARKPCIVHKMDNVLDYVPSKQREQVEPELKALFYQKDRQAADQAIAAFVEKYHSIYPTAIDCLQRDLEACLTFYAYPRVALEDDPHQQCH